MNLEKRIAELEKQIPPEQGPTLVILPDTTIEEAQADYQTRTGTEVSIEEFSRLLATLPLVVVTIHEAGGASTNPWIGTFCKRGI
jgi:hypothetical protein